MVDSGTGQTVQALLDERLVTDEQVAAATESAGRSGRTALQELLDAGIVGREQVVRTAATAAGLRYVDVSEYVVNASAAATLPADFARRSHRAATAGEDGELLVAVGIRQAGNIELKDDLTRLTKSRVRFAVANRADIDGQDQPGLPGRGRARRPHLRPGLRRGRHRPLGLTEVSDEAPVVRFVNLLITQAITDRASDIHLEPTEHDLRVRYRIDGVLHDAHRSPKNIQNGVISRLKIMADMNIAERRLPQDGRLSVNHQGRKVDLRIATLPTVWGEKVVARILDNSTARLGLEDLGFSEANYRRFETSFTKPYGMILATGPTGSG